MSSKIAAKIAKIIAKAESTNHTAEAEALMAKVADLLNEHGLSMADVAMADRDDPVGVQKSAARAWKSASWKTNLFAALAKFYGCEMIYFNVGNEIVHDVVGRESARTTFVLMAPFVCKQITSAARALVKSGDFPTMSRAERAVGNALMSRVWGLVQEQKKKHEAVRVERGFALVPVDQIEAVTAVEYPRLKAGRDTKVSNPGAAARQAASDISLHRQTTGSGQRRLS